MIWLVALCLEDEETSLPLYVPRRKVSTAPSHHLKKTSFVVVILHFVYSMSVVIY